jgi:trehalose-6-phosphatase
VTKGTAVRTLLDLADHDAVFAFYAGNDANDWDALEAVAELGGIAVGIGARAPATAQFRLPNEAALKDLLLTLMEQLDSTWSSDP